MNLPILWLSYNWVLTFAVQCMQLIFISVIIPVHHYTEDFRLHVCTVHVIHNNSRYSITMCTVSNWYSQFNKTLAFNTSYMFSEWLLSYHIAKQILDYARQQWLIYTTIAYHLQLYLQNNSSQHDNSCQIMQYNYDITSWNLNYKCTPKSQTLEANQWWLHKESMHAVDLPSDVVALYQLTELVHHFPVWRRGYFLQMR